MALHSWLAWPQRRLGPLGSSCCWSSTSLVPAAFASGQYAAVPHMTERFQHVGGMVNLTLVGYFLFFAVGLLAFGPAKRPLRTQTRAAGRHSHVCAERFILRCQWTSSFSSPRAIPCKPYAGASERGVHGGGEGRRRPRTARGSAVRRAGDVRGRPIAGAGGGRAHPAGRRLAHDVLGTGGHRPSSAPGWRCCSTRRFPSRERHEGHRAGKREANGARCAQRGFSAFLGIVGLYNTPFMAYIAVGSYVYIRVLRADLSLSTACTSRSP